MIWAAHCAFVVGVAVGSIAMLATERWRRPPVRRGAFEEATEAISRFGAMLGKVASGHYHVEHTLHGMRTPIGDAAISLAEELLEPETPKGDA